MAKSSSRRVASAPARVKTAVSLTVESFKRLGAACIQENMTQSELVELMITRLLSGYVISVRGPGIGGGPASPAVSISRSADGDSISPVVATVGP
jgi:hypothetical protein